MKKLEQKYIAHYPLGDGGIKIITSLNQGTFITPITQIDFNESDLVYGNSYLDKDDGYYPYNLEAIHPILRPLSDLTSVIEHNGKKYCILSLWYSIEASEENDYDVLGIIPDYWQNIVNNIESNGFGRVDYGFVKILLEHHFDIGGLIPAGLAIDINTLK